MANKKRPFKFGTSKEKDWLFLFIRSTSIQKNDQWIIQIKVEKINSKRAIKKGVNLEDKSLDKII